MNFAQWWCVGQIACRRFLHRADVVRLFLSKYRAKIFPLHVSRSPMSRKSKSKRPLKGAGAIPAIFVKVRSNRGYLGYEYKQARIQVRGSKYRYLVWYEKRQKREFYLGRISALSLHRSPARARPRAPGPERARDIVGAGR